MKKKKAVKSSADVSVTVALDETTAASVKKTVGELKKVGLHVVQNLEEVGVVLGTCAPEAIPKLRALDGVTAVEAEREIQLPPPGAEIQ